MFYSKLKTCVFMLSIAAISTSAQAQNKPAHDKLKPVESSSALTIPCPEYGPKFFRAAGSAVCIKVDGMVRGDAMIRHNRSSLENGSGFQSRAELGLEAKTQTDYGPMRMVVTTRGMIPANGARP
jgi:hypothetical protein